MKQKLNYLLGKTPNIAYYFNQIDEYTDKISLNYL